MVPATPVRCAAPALTVLATPATVVEYIPPAPAVSYATPVPTVLATPAAMVEHIPPAPAVNYATPVPTVLPTPAAMVELHRSCANRELRCATARPLCPVLLVVACCSQGRLSIEKFGAPLKAFRVVSLLR